jgi:hypothetical protein
MNATTKQTQNFNFSEEFPIFTHNDEDRKHQLSEAYLRKTGGEYSVALLGKNGEP